MAAPRTFAILSLVCVVAVAFLFIKAEDSDQRLNRFETQSAVSDSHLSDSDGVGETATAESVAVPVSEQGAKVPSVPSSAFSNKLRDTPSYSSLYDRYIESAQSGDADAAVLILTLLRDCKSVAQLSFDTEMTQSLRGTGLVEAVPERRIADECKELFNEEHELAAAYDHWYRIVKESRHPLFLVRQRNFTTDEARSYVIAALMQKYSEPIAFQETFLAAARLKGPDNEVDFYAWQLLACAASPLCDSTSAASAIQQQTSEYLYQDIKDRQQDLLVAIEAKDLDALGL